MGNIIYLTGAPATGKTTLTRGIVGRTAEVKVFGYSKELARVTSARVGRDSLGQHDMRESSAKLITREDVTLADQELIEFATEFKKHDGFLVIDSHSVTIENFGFRVTPFSKDMLNRLAPDIIVCLYADALTLESRIKVKSDGRPLPPRSELDRHVDLQCQVASIYAIETGAQLYFLDASVPSPELVSNFMRVTKVSENLER